METIRGMLIDPRQITRVKSQPRMRSNNEEYEDIAGRYFRTISWKVSLLVNKTDKLANNLPDVFPKPSRI